MKWGKFNASFFYEKEIQGLLSKLQREAILVFIAVLAETWRQDDEYSSETERFGYLEVDTKMFAHYLNMTSTKLIKNLDHARTACLLEFDYDNEILSIKIRKYSRFRHKDAFSSKKRNLTSGPSGPSRKEKSKVEQYETRREEMRKEKEEKRFDPPKAFES